MRVNREREAVTLHDYHPALMLILQVTIRLFEGIRLRCGFIGIVPTRLSINYLPLPLGKRREGTHSFAHLIVSPLRVLVRSELLRGVNLDGDVLSALLVCQGPV